MSIPMIACASMAFLVMANAAQAAPKVSGKYALMISTQCEARFTTTMGTYSKPSGTGLAVSSINTSQSGEFNIGVGSLTFPSAAASTGNARFEAFQVKGGVLRINNTGTGMATHSEAVAGRFAFTNTTFTLTPASEPAMIWTIRVGDIVSGVARTLYMVRQEGARCLNSITATKQ